MTEAGTKSCTMPFTAGYQQPDQRLKWLHFSTVAASLGKLPPTTEASAPSAEHQSGVKANAELRASPRQCALTTAVRPLSSTLTAVGPLGSAR